MKTEVGTLALISWEQPLQRSPCMSFILLSLTVKSPVASVVIASLFGLPPREGRRYAVMLCTSKTMQNQTKHYLSRDELVQPSDLYFRRARFESQPGHSPQCFQEDASD
jgi:hypothetical protein